MGRDQDDGGGGRGRGSDAQRRKKSSRRGKGTQSGKNTTQPTAKSGSGDVRPKWICKTDDLKDDTFFWGDGMNDKYSSSRQHFLQYATKSFSGNEKKSIENGFHTFIGVEVPPLVTTEAEFDALGFLMKRRYDNVCKEYDKAKVVLVKNLSTLYGNLIEACEPSLLEKIKRHPDFTFNDVNGVPCAMALMLIIQDLCSSTAGINYAPEMGVASLYDLLLIDGNAMTLQKYVEIFTERYEACKRLGYKFGTREIGDLLIAQSIKHNGLFSTAHTTLAGNLVAITEEMVVTQIFFRRCGDKYEELRQKFKNDYRIENYNHFPTTITTMSNLLENYTPMSDTISKNIMNQINRRDQKIRDKLNNKGGNDDDKGGGKPIPENVRSGNTDETTGKSFNQDGTPAEEGDKNSEDPPKKDFRPGHPSAASGLSKEQRTQRPSAIKGGHTGTQRSQQQAGNRKSDHNRDTKRPQECGKKENPNNNNTTNNNNTHDKSDIKCYACGEMGHYSTDKECSLFGKKVTKGASFLLSDFDYDDSIDDEDYEFNFATYGSLMTTITADFRTTPGHVLNNINQGRLPDTWILLDNQSTVNVFWNTMFLVNVRTTTRQLNLQTNAGAATINEIGELPGFGTVWVHRTGIANILSLDGVADTPGFHIDYTTQTGNRDFVDETAHGETKRFIGNGRGLHFLYCAHHFGPDRNGCVFGEEIYNTEKRMTWRQDESSFLVETVDGNRLQFSTRDVKRADELRRFEEVAAFPSRDTLQQSINKNVIKDSLHTLQDLNITHRIHGRSRHAIQGKRTQRRNKPVEVDLATISVPRSLQKHYQAITLWADVMFINKNPVLVTVSRHLHYSTGQVLRSTKMDDLEENLIKVMKGYQYRGFVIKLLLVDKQFSGLKHQFAGVTVNLVIQDEHVPEVERLKRTINERCRCYFVLIPFKKIPHRMAIELVYTCIFYINAFPWISGPEKTLSPFTIVQG